MASFRESGLCFEFSDQWEVYQLDQEADYRNKIEKKYLPVQNGSTPQL